MATEHLTNEKGEILNGIKQRHTGPPENGDGKNGGIGGTSIND